MVQAIPVSDLTLRQVKQQFGLVQVDDQTVAAWQPPFPELPPLERQMLDRVHANYAYLSERSLAEGLVNMVVVSPLLDLAGFYQPPFDVDIEVDLSIPIQAKDGNHSLAKGRIDVLVCNQQLWILVIESKRPRFDVMEALPQALVYMMGCPQRSRSRFGLATNGREFLFIYVPADDTGDRGEAVRSTYCLSPIFSMTTVHHDLGIVLNILKRIGAALLP